MLKEGMTVHEAAEKWIQGMNAIPRGMIEKLMEVDEDDWREVTDPSTGDLVSVFNELGDIGEVISYDKENDLYTIQMRDGKEITANRGGFYVQYDDPLPAWGTMWSFGNSLDGWWLEECDGIQLMSRCGFRIYESCEFGYFFGIDGGGYDFYQSHWIPLYRARGLQWHDPKTEEEFV